MKRISMIFLALFLLSAISFPVFATEDYAKGDFMILSLKDSPETVRNKIQYLVGTDQISGILKKKTSFSGKLFGTSYNCHTYFFKNHMYQLHIEFTDQFSSSDFDLGLKKFTFRVNSVLKKKFGRPTDDFGYPEYSSMTEGYSNTVSRWVFPNKTIEVGVVESDYKYYTLIQISDNELTMKKDKLARKQQKIEDKKAEEFF